MKPLDLEILSSVLYFYIPTCWEDFSDNGKIKDICTRKRFTGKMVDHVCSFLHFLECTFENCEFKDVEFEEISFVRCKFINCKFNNCTIKKSSFINCACIQLKFIQTSFFSSIMKETSCKEGIDLSSCSFRYFIIDDHSFQAANIFIPSQYHDDSTLLSIETADRQLLCYSDYIKLL